MKHKQRHGHRTRHGHWRW